MARFFQQNPKANHPLRGVRARFQGSKARLDKDPLGGTRFNRTRTTLCGFPLFVRKALQGGDLSHPLCVIIHRFRANQADILKAGPRSNVPPLIAVFPQTFRLEGSLAAPQPLGICTKPRRQSPTLALNCHWNMYHVGYGWSFQVTCTGRRMRTPNSAPFERDQMERSRANRAHASTRTAHH